MEKENKLNFRNAEFEPLSDPEVKSLNGQFYLSSDLHENSEVERESLLVIQEIWVLGASGSHTSLHVAP